MQDSLKNRLGEKKMLHQINEAFNDSNYGMDTIIKVKLHSNFNDVRLEDNLRDFFEHKGYAIDELTIDVY